MEQEKTPGREFGFLDLLAIVLRYWKRVLATVVITTAAAVAAALAWPPTYVTSTVLVPFAGTQSRSQLGLGQLPAGVAGLIGAGSGSSSSERLIGAILKSRTLSDSMARRVGRGASGEAQVRQIVAKDTRIQRNADGSIMIEVRAKDPRLAADVANAYPLLINRLLVELNSDGAARKERFLTAQLGSAREKLTQSEQRLLAFQRRSSATDIPEQARRTFDAAASLQTGIYQQEVEVAQLRRTLAPNHPRLQAAISQLETQRAQLRRLSAGGGGSQMFLPIGQGPELKAASTRLLREFAKDEQIYTALTSALAEAQIDANNNLPVLSVLDTAPPGGSTRSLPSTLVLGSLLGLVLGMVIAFASEAVHRARRAPGNERFFAAWADFKRDLGLRPVRGAGLSAGD